jgi:hypothetical protein
MKEVVRKQLLLEIPLVLVEEEEGSLREEAAQAVVVPPLVA